MTVWVEEEKRRTGGGFAGLGWMTGCGHGRALGVVRLVWSLAARGETWAAGNAGP